MTFPDAVPRKRNGFLEKHPRLDADQERKLLLPHTLFSQPGMSPLTEISPLSSVLQPSLRSRSSLVPILRRNEILLAEFLGPKLRRSTRIALGIKARLRIILSVGFIVEEDFQPAGIVYGSRALSKVLRTVLLGLWVTRESEKNSAGREGGEKGG